MNSLEAEAVAQAVAHAHGGCRDCAMEIADVLQQRFDYTDLDWRRLVAEAGEWEDDSAT